MDRENETELERNYRLTSMAASEAQMVYLADKTPANWAAYLAADAAHRPYMVAMSQKRMQDQINRMDADQLASFNRMIS